MEKPYLIHSLSNNQMKYLFLILSFWAFYFQAIAQNSNQHILLEYDNAGNRIVRRQEGTDIEVHKEILTNSSFAGDVISFLIQVTNNGVQTATNLQLQDEWKDGCFAYMDNHLADGHPFPYNFSVSNVTSHSANLFIQQLNPGQSFWLVMNFTHLTRCATCPNTLHFEHYEGNELNTDNNQSVASALPQAEANEVFIDAPNALIQPSSALGFAGGGGQWQLSPTNGSPLEVQITGSTTLEIPAGESLVIDNCNMKLGSAAKIIVRDGASLQIIGNSHLHGCLDMWDRIEVEAGGSISIEKSLIEDADYAVYLNDGVASMNCVLSVFRNNAIGIYMPSSPIGGTNQIQNYILDNNTFEGTNSMLAAFPNQVNIPLGLPYAGIDVTDVVFKVTNNHFHSLTNGIIGRKSDIYVTDCDFNAILPVNYPNSPFNGSAVAILGSKCVTSFPPKNHCMASLWLSGVNGTGNSSFTANNVWFGVWADKASVEVSNTIMYDARVGVYIQNAVNKVAEVYSNEIHAWNKGINLYMTDNAVKMYIHDNQIYLNAINNGSYGIGVNDYGIGNSNLSIEHNTVEVLNGSCGITILSSSHGKVLGNTVNMNTNNAYLAAGIGITGGDAMQVECNNVNNVNGNGYVFVYTPNSTIGCNRDFGSSTGYNFFAPCLGTTFRGNEMHDNDLGLLFNNSVMMDEQKNTGNRWFGNFTLGARNDAYSSVNPTNLLYLSPYPDYNTNPYNPNMGELLPPSYMPAPTTTGAFTWFLQQSPQIAPYDCYSANYCGWNGEGTNSTFRISNLDSLIATDSLQPIVYTQELKKIAIDYLYEKLSLSPNLSENNSLLQDFKENKDETTLSDVVEVRTAANNLYNPSIETLLNNNYALIKGHFAQLNYNESLLTSSLSLSLQDSLNLLAQDSMLYAEIKQLENANQVLLSVIDNQRLSDVNGLIVENGIIMTSELMQQNEKAVNNIYFNTIEQGNLFLDATQQSVLESIIYQCPIIGGISVYKARSLYEMINDNVEYNDNSACNAAGVSLRTTQPNEQIEKVQENKVTLYPNPAQNEVSFEFSQTLDKEYTLFIYDVLGKKIQQLIIPKATNLYKLNLTNYPQGIYSYQIQGDITNKTGKFVIVR
jgi:hypothetical protein